MFPSILRLRAQASGWSGERLKFAVEFQVDTVHFSTRCLLEGDIALNLNLNPVIGLLYSKFVTELELHSGWLLRLQLVFAIIVLVVPKLY